MDHNMRITIMIIWLSTWLIRSMGYSYLIWFLVKMWDLPPWRQSFPPRRLVAGAGPARPARCARPGHGPLGRRRPLRSGHEGRPCGAVDVGRGGDGGGPGGWKVAGRATQISPGNGGWFRDWGEMAGPNKDLGKYGNGRLFQRVTPSIPWEDGDLNGIHSNLYGDSTKLDSRWWHRVTI